MVDQWKRKTPAENDDDWIEIWDSIQLVQIAKRPLKIISAVVSAWKIILLGMGVGAMLGGSQLLKILGIL